jgi:hypothetical protein
MPSASAAAEVEELDRAAALHLDLGARAPGRVEPLGGSGLERIADGDRHELRGQEWIVGHLHVPQRVRGARRAAHLDRDREGGCVALGVDQHGRRSIAVERAER